MSPARTAVIVPVPEVAPAVDAWRELTCNAKPSLGVPPHITLLFPFVSPVDDDVLAALGEIFAPIASFRLELRELRRFVGVLYLAPEPEAPFARLTRELVGRYPDHPPYGDPSIPLVPHLTVAQGDAELFDRVEAEVRPALPLRAVVSEALLLEEGERWRVRARFPFRP